MTSIGMVPFGSSPPEDCYGQVGFNRSDHGPGSTDLLPACVVSPILFAY